MANPTVGTGLRPARRRDGAAWTGQLTKANIAFNNANKIGKGDPIISLSSGFIDIWASGAIRGVFWGCEYLDPGTGYINWFNAWNAPAGLAATVVTAYIIDDPDLIFEIRAASGLNVTQGNVWSNATMTGMGTITALPAGMSSVVLSSVATTSTFPLRIVGRSDKVGNDNTLAQNLVEVSFNNFELRTGVTGI
jgi:hypothetical protein